MRIGRLDRRITIEALTETQSASGEPQETWSTFAEVWAARRDVSGSERFRSQQELAEKVTRFTVRFLDGLDAKHRIIGDDGLIYDIQSIMEMGRRQFQEITAEARGQAGV
jgi:SPP1 family predicted phage head-tail adaptor